MTAQPWADALHQQNWPHGQKLTEQQIDRIDALASGLDMEEIVEDFSDYWLQNFTTIAPSRIKTWVLALRLRTWIRNSLARQPVADDRSDAYIRRYLASQRARGNR